MGTQVEGTVEIAADPHAVMAVIADVAHYPEWTSGITAVEVLGTGADGRPSRARMQLDAGPVRDTYVVDYTWDDRSVSWTLVEGDMLTAMDGAYDVEPADGGSLVRFRLEVDVKVPLLGMLKRKAAKLIVDAALGGLKSRVEGGP